jgi:hypothetical protein
MALVQTNLRLSDTSRPDVTTYLPPWNYLLGFTTSVRQNSIGNTVNDPRVITRLDVSVLALASRCIVLMYKVAICHPST